MSWFRILLTVTLLSLTGCATKKIVYVPELTDLQGDQQQKDCELIFPKGQWQFVHFLDFNSADGSFGTLIGVTVLKKGEISAALLTVEGVTLFEASLSREGRLDVHRAVVPFDKAGFAEGLMKDVQAIFSPPPGSAVSYGSLAKGVAVCRYAAANGGVTDIAISGDDAWQINTYDADLIRNQSIQADVDAGTLELYGFRPVEYELKMRLISKERLELGGKGNSAADEEKTGSATDQ